MQSGRSADRDTFQCTVCPSCGSTFRVAGAKDFGVLSGDSTLHKALGSCVSPKTAARVKYGLLELRNTPTEGMTHASL